MSISRNTKCADKTDFPRPGHIWKALLNMKVESNMQLGNINHILFWYKISRGIYCTDEKFTISVYFQGSLDL